MSHHTYTIIYYHFVFIFIFILFIYYYVYLLLFVFLFTVCCLKCMIPDNSNNNTVSLSVKPCLVVQYEVQ